MSNEHLLVSVEASVTTLTLNRPERLNALDAGLLSSLADALGTVARDRSIRAVVLTGAGRAFCSGGDLRGINELFPERPSDGFLPMAARFHSAILEIRQMKKPVIAAINGPAAGGGFSLALACDLRLMSSTAFLQQGYTSQGLCLDGGGTHSLVRLVGLAKSLEIVLLDDRIDADTALRLGLVTRVIAPGELEKETLLLANRLADRATGALGRAKSLLNQSFDTALEVQLEAERHGLGDAADSPEGREGMAAFLEKRPAKFRV